MPLLSYFGCRDAGRPAPIFSCSQARGSAPMHLQRHPARSAGLARRTAIATSVALLALAFAAGSVDAADTVKAPLKKTILDVTGTPAADVIVVRLAQADSSTVEIDVGGDGSAQFAFP